MQADAHNSGVFSVIIFPDAVRVAVCSNVLRDSEEWFTPPFSVNRLQWQRECCFVRVIILASEGCAGSVKTIGLGPSKPIDPI